MNDDPVFCTRCQPHVNEAIRTAQAEQQRRDAEIARGKWRELSKHFHSPHTVCRE
ncbi:hypothetical protein LCGC14_3011980, partial [marine sediment metagenome]